MPQRKSKSENRRVIRKTRNAELSQMNSIIMGVCVLFLAAVGTIGFLVAFGSVDGAAGLSSVETLGLASIAGVVGGWKLFR